MNKETFRELLLEAGFKTYGELANALNITTATINSWNTKHNPYPPYLENVLELAKIAKEYDKLEKIRSRQKDNYKKILEELNIENAELKKMFFFLQSVKDEVLKELKNT